VSARTHVRILFQALAVWAVFWVAGLPRYYQQYSSVVLGVGCTVLSSAIGLVALLLLVRARPERRASLALWLSVYYTIPFAILDTLYCGLYLDEGWAYLYRFWYLSVFYIIPWLTFVPTAWLLERFQHSSAQVGAR